ncbi:glycosyltransferase family 4 protein [Microbacterium koreense]
MFAIPGDLATVTGGYLYEKRLLEGLRSVGTSTVHLPLGASFPFPTPEDHDHAVAALGAVGAGTPLILDGFVFGSLDPVAMATLRAPVVGIVHHPLAYEEGLAQAERVRLYRSERENLRHAAAVLVPSPHTARILVDDYGADPSRVVVARPGTDQPTGRRMPSDPPLILSVGIQHPRKGHDVLLRSLASVRDLEWNAVIAGTPYDPDYGAELDAMRTELGLATRVRLAGSVTDAERDDLYRSAGVFALATRYEGYGLVFDEALAHGVPIVSCRAGAVADTVPEAAGLLVPPDDPDRFADALRAVLTDARRRVSMAEAAARAGASLPGWTDTARAAQRVLDAVASR